MSNIAGIWRGKSFSWKNVSVVYGISSVNIASQEVILVFLSSGIKENGSRGLNPTRDKHQCVLKYQLPFLFTSRGSLAFSAPKEASGSRVRVIGRQQAPCVMLLWLHYSLLCWAARRKERRLWAWRDRRGGGFDGRSEGEYGGESVRDSLIFL